MSYLVDKPPTEDALLRTGQRPWEIPEHRQNLTATRGAFKTYSTYVFFLEFSDYSFLLYLGLNNAGFSFKNN